MKKVAGFIFIVLASLLLFSQDAMHYFPPRTFSDSPTLEQGFVKWYSHNLAALHEPSLWSESKDQHRRSFRFLWLRTWDKPLSIRVDMNTDETATLTLAVCSGTGGDNPGNLETHGTKQLSSEQVNALTVMFRTAQFWAMPTTEESSGKDGARWILEGVDGGQYHIVERWSPKDGPVRQLGLQLLRLSAYNVSSDKVY